MSAFKQHANLFLKIIEDLLSLLKLHLWGLIFPDVEGKLKIKSTVLYLQKKHSFVVFQHFSINKILKYIFF